MVQADFELLRQLWSVGIGICRRTRCKHANSSTLLHFCWCGMWCCSVIFMDPFADLCWSLLISADIEYEEWRAKWQHKERTSKRKEKWKWKRPTQAPEGQYDQNLNHIQKNPIWLSVCDDVMTPRWDDVLMIRMTSITAKHTKCEGETAVFRSVLLPQHYLFSP